MDELARTTQASSEEEHDLKQLLEDLTGQAVPFGSKACESMLHLFEEGQSGLGYSQLNELLLTLGYDRVTHSFFQYLVDGTTELSRDRCDKQPDFMTWLLAITGDCDLHSNESSLGQLAMAPKDFYFVSGNCRVPFRAGLYRRSHFYQRVLESRATRSPVCVEIDSSQRTSPQPRSPDPATSLSHEA